MEKLRDYLNGLSLQEQIAFALACKTTIGSLRTAISKKTLLGEKLCVRIEKHSNGKVTRKMLRKDWKECWPELIKAA